ncbi:DUF4238 domain-containing protein [Longispora sp. NPDC051575]|uniref:DUF4238 domain-containing protein n=1 Tax=Longispora sp. NPDC051575 TaxID=3154943 RepID=UPI003427305C
MTRAKRHHYVPASYLARFGENGSVLVRRRGKSTMYPTNVKNVAVEGGFYEITGDDGQPSDSVERALAGLESKALTALTGVEQSQRLPSPGSSDREALATFLAVQFTRTPLNRERIMFPVRVARYAGDREIDATLMAEYLEREHLGFRPQDSEVRGALDLTQYMLGEREFFTKDNAIRLAFSAVEPLERVILGMHWSLEVARKPRLVTSDAPLVLWRPPTSRAQFEGLGLNNAEEVRFPINPAMQLLLTHQVREPVTRIEPDRVRACNADLASACYQVVVGHPQRERQLRLLELRARRPVVRFNTGPGYRTMPDGTSEYMGEILHSWVPWH